MLTYLTSWVTPISLFILINAVIATIFITSNFTADKSHSGAAPSFLTRVKSFNFNPTRPEQPPSLLGRLKSITLTRTDSSLEPATPPPEKKQSSPEEKPHHENPVGRSKSDAVTLTPATSLRRRLQKSLSEKLQWAAFTPPETESPAEIVNEIERRRPATARPEIGELETDLNGGEEEVDVRADDFINKFKQQLKLQRLESLLRYRDMIKGKG